MDIDMTWLDYATYGEDGFVNGIREDAPQSVIDTYNKEKEREERYKREGKKIPR